MSLDTALSRLDPVNAPRPDGRASFGPRRLQLLRDASMHDHRLSTGDRFDRGSRVDDRASFRNPREPAIELHRTSEPS